MDKDFLESKLNERSELYLLIKNNQKLKNQINLILDVLKNTFENKNKIFVCGNGGSAEQANHFCAELIGQYQNINKPIACISLNSNIPLITSLSNDYNYEFVFDKQIEALAKKSDLLIAFSTSGTSKNIINALKTAKNEQMKTILITGEKDLKNNIDFLLNVDYKSTEVIQEVHLFYIHLFAEYLKNLLKNTQ